MSEEPSNSQVYDVPALLEAQRGHFDSGRTRNLENRIQVLKNLGTAIEQQSDALIEALSADMGKPPVESYLSEIFFLLSEIRLVTKRLRRWSRPRRVRNPFYFFPSRSEVRREPYGTTLIISAWNYPLQLSLAPAVSAIAAGNVVMLKPSESAPHTARLIAKIISSVFDKEHFAVIEGGPEIGRALLNEKFDCWFYTGSERIGRLYAEAAAKAIAPITLELGGKCPCVISPDVNLDIAVQRIVSGKFLNAGQTCIAPDFVVLPETLQESFIEKATAALQSAYPECPSPDLAKIVSQEHYERLSNLIPDGAIRIGKDHPELRYLTPTLIPDVSWDSPAMQEEIFGPVLPVLTYQSLDELLLHLRKLPSPLALYAFSKDSTFLEAIANAIPSGSVCFNDVLKQATNLNLPFGGVGASGMGRYRGQAGFENFTYERAVTRRGFSRDLFAVTPPYENRLEQLKKFLK